MRAMTVHCHRTLEAPGEGLASVPPCSQTGALCGCTRLVEGNSERLRDPGWRLRGGADAVHFVTIAVDEVRELEVTVELWKQGHVVVTGQKQRFLVHLQLFR